MTARIAGMGWVTPLGAGLDEVWARVTKGEQGEMRELSRPNSEQKYRCLVVPAGLTKTIERNPRLRRSSTISLLAATAGLAALEHAGIEMTHAVADRTGLVFAIGDGGVIYTRKFYEQIVTQGAQTASPLLFPETVYNAPASHLAALLGINGMSYTLVGDGSVGIGALNYAQQLLQTHDLDQVIVVGGEEIDWVLCEAYREWRLTAPHSGNPNRGMVLGEGAAALVIGREGRCELNRIHPGVPFFSRAEAGNAVNQVVANLAAAGPVDVVIGSANGTFLDALESTAFEVHCPKAVRIFPKQSFGEAPGAGALMQTIIGALALEKSPAKPDAALVCCLGLNQHAAGLTLTRSS